MQTPRRHLTVTSTLWESALKEPAPSARSDDRPIKHGLLAMMAERQYLLTLSGLVTVFMLLSVVPVLRNGPAFAAFAVLRIATFLNDFFQLRALAQALRKGAPTRQPLRRLVFSMGISGFVWGAMLWPLPQADLVEAAACLVLNVVVIGIFLSAMNSAFVPAVRQSFLIGTSLAIIPKSLAADPVMIAPQLCLYGLMVVLLVTFGNQLVRQSRHALTLRFRNAEMARKLNQANQQLIEALGQANWLADRDVLTKLRNRRAFETGLSQLRDRSKGGTIALLLIDLDHFKRINDSFGHNTGDGVLVAVGSALRKWERRSRARLTGRWGGEEFIAALPVADLGELSALAEDLRCTIGRIATDLPWPADLALSASIGCTLLRDAAPLDDALSQADTALYEAKHAGRNQWRLAA